MNKESINKIMIIVLLLGVVLAIVSIILPNGLLDDVTDDSTVINLDPPITSEGIYQSSCTALSYEQLLSNLDKYIGEDVTYQLQVEQADISADTSKYLMSANSNELYYITTEQNTGLYTDDYIQVWGEVVGAYTYESIAGLTITLPHIHAWYIEEPDLSFDVGDEGEWDKLSVAIKSVEVADFYEWSGSSGNVYNETAVPGNIFIIIDVEINNYGEEYEYIYAGDFSLVDSNGIKYDYDSGTYSMTNGLEGVDLYQDQKAIGVILYEIPDDMDQFTIQYNFGTIYDPLIGEWDITL